MGQRTGVNRNDAERLHDFLARLRCRNLRVREPSVSTCTHQFLLLTLNPVSSAWLRACQKVFGGGGVPRFKRIIKPLDVAKTGGLGQLDAKHGLHQSSSPAQRQHFGNQKVELACLKATAMLISP